jgi:hypothetical protein
MSFDGKGLKELLERNKIHGEGGTTVVHLTGKLSVNMGRSKVIMVDID